MIKKGAQGSLEYIIIIGGIIILAAATYFMLKGFTQSTGAGTTDQIGVAGEKFRLDLENLGRSETRFLAKSWGSFPYFSQFTVNNTGEDTTATITFYNLTDYGLNLSELELAYNDSGEIKFLEFEASEPGDPNPTLNFTDEFENGTSDYFFFHNNSSADELDNLNSASDNETVNVTDDGGTPVESPDTTPPTILISSTAYGSAGSVKDADIQVTVTDANSSIAEVYYSIGNSPNFSADGLYYGYEGMTLEAHPEDNAYNSGTEIIHIIATVPSEDNYTIRVKAVDEYGNEKEETQNVSIVAGTPPVDTTPPEILGAEPANNTQVDVTPLTINITTDETAHCRFSTSPETPYYLMTNFNNTDSTFHSITNIPLSDGVNYKYYIRCNDPNENVNPSDYILNFTKANVTPPAILSTQPANNSLVNGSLMSINITIDLTTDETAHCRFSNESGNPYSSMTDFDNTDSTLHSITNIALQHKQNYKYYFKCNDSDGNANPSDYELNFSYRYIYSGEGMWLMFMHDLNHTGYFNTPFDIPHSTGGPYSSLELLWTFSTGSYVWSSPAVADLDGDSDLEIVSGHYGKNLFCLDHNGNQLWNFTTVSNIYSSPSIADFDGDSDLEIVFGENGKNFYCLDHNGNQLWNFTTSNYIYIESTPAVADLDGDSDLEIVFGSNGGNIYCLDHNGNKLWNLTTWGIYYSSAAVADLDGDPSNGLEIVIGTDNYDLYALNHTGSLLWNFTTGSYIESSPAIADLDGDSDLEIVFGSLDDKLYALNHTGGHLWNYTTGESIYYSSLAIADLDGDPSNGLEIVFGTDDFSLYALNRTGGLLWSYPTGSYIESSPAIADLTGDGRLEIVFGSGDGNLYVLNRTGSHLWNYSTGEEGIFYSSPAIADLDGDGNLEIVIGSDDGNIYCLEVGSAPIFNPQPANNSLVFVSQIDINISTSTTARCRYSQTPGTAYTSMTDFNATNAKFHQITNESLSYLANTYYFKCNDTYGNVTPDYVLNFTRPHTTPPVILSTQPSGTAFLNFSTLTINITTDEIAHCRFSNQSGTPYTSMTDFSNTDSTFHNITNIPLAEETNYIYYFKCNDTYGVVNPSDYALSFTRSRWGPDIKLTTGASLSGYSTSLSIAVSGSDVHVVWFDGRDGNKEIYYKNSSDAGVTWGPDYRLTNNGAGSDDPQIAVSGSNLHVVWEDGRDGSQYETYYKNSSDGGTTWGSDTRLSVDDALESINPSIAVSGSNVHVAWNNDNSYMSSMLYYRNSNDGGTTWGSNVKLYDEGSYHYARHPSIAVNASNVHLVFQEFISGGVPGEGTRTYYTNSGNGGASWGPQEVIWETSNLPKIAVSGSSVYVVWKGVSYKNSSDGGTTWGTAIGLGGGEWPLIAVSGSNVHVVWKNTGAGTYGLHYKNSSTGGATWGNDMRLTHTWVYYPSIAVSGSDVHLVWFEDWEGNDEIYYKRYII